MINYFSLPSSTLPMSMRSLRRILEARGWRAEKLYPEGKNNLILTRPDGKILHIASSTPPTTSVYSLRLADDKLMTYSLLKDLNIPQPETVLLHSPEDALPLLERYDRIVVKPTDGAHGLGVTTNITSLAAVAPAIEKAVAASPDAKLALAQQQLDFELPELRLICINYQFVIAIARIPAMVTGDGNHTVAKLIELENSTIRSAPYTSNLAYIDLDSARTYLGNRIDYTPEAGEKIRVSATCNVGQGGTVEDYSDRISPELKSRAERITRAAELPVAGIDLYDDYVLEINACPSLYYPLSDPALAELAVEKYVDYLSTL